MAQKPCPGANQTTYDSSTGPLFAIFCGVDWPSGDDFLDGNGTVTDLGISTTYTLGAFIEACNQHNQGVATGQTPCRAVPYQANLTTSFGGGQAGNCFLKNHIGKYFPSANWGMAAGMVGG
jgi:hypothetical protein